ncbi:Hypothetical protein UVM_LOCUS386, partial [uncultured virus]
VFATTVGTGTTVDTADHYFLHGELLKKYLPRMFAEATFPVAQDVSNKQVTDPLRRLTTRLLQHIGYPLGGVAVLPSPYGPLGNSASATRAFRDLIHLLYSVEYNGQRSMISTRQQDFDRMVALLELISLGDTARIDKSGLRAWFDARLAREEVIPRGPVIDGCS